MKGEMNRRDFVEQMGIISAGIGAFIIPQSCTQSSVKSQVFEKLSRSSPEAQGVSAELIADFLNAVEESGLEFHSFMMLRNAHVIAEGWWNPFGPELKHTLYSLSKSFTSTAVGLAIDDGLLDLKDKVISFFPDDLPENISENLSAMDIRHLLTMNTGHSEKPIGKMQESSDNNWAKAFLAFPVEHEPGTHFLYNTGASYMLSAIVQKVANRNIHDYLSERLFPHLNIADSDWEVDPNGISVGGYGLRVTTEDIAKFGQLYLQEGAWQVKQIISESWVREATSKQTETPEGSSDWNQGYGYQFWRCKPQPSFYRGDGAFGQYCIVIPHENVVIAITSESSDMQKSMDLVWDHLLPAITESSTLPPNKVGVERLYDQLKSLALPTLKVGAMPLAADQVHGQSYNLKENESGVQSLSFEFINDQCVVNLHSKERTVAIKCGFGKWIINDDQYAVEGSLFVIPNTLTSKIAACAGWDDDGHLILKIKKIEGMHSDTWTCQFSEGQVAVDFMNSIHVLQGNEDLRQGWEGSVAL